MLCGFVAGAAFLMLWPTNAFGSPPGAGACTQSVLNLPTRVQLLACGPLVLRVPSRWNVSWVKTLTASPQAVVGALVDFSVWVDSPSSSTFATVGQLEAFVTAHMVKQRTGSVDAGRVTLSSGPAVLVKRKSAGRLYEQYWLLHDGGVYRFSCQGTLAYLAAHKGLVSRLANAIAFRPEELKKAFEAIYVTNWTAPVGSGPTQPAAAIELGDISLAESVPWHADLTVRVHGTHTLTIKRVVLLISDSASDPTGTPSLVQQALSVSGKPFKLTVERNGQWDGTITGDGQLFPGSYGALEIDYTFDGHDGIHIYPSLARPRALAR